MTHSASRLGSRLGALSSATGAQHTSLVPTLAEISVHLESSSGGAAVSAVGAWYTCSSKPRLMSSSLRSSYLCSIAVAD